VTKNVKRVVAAGAPPSEASPPFDLPLRPVANICANGSCPTVYQSGATAVVQGYTVSAAEAGVALPDGEVLVRIPVELLAEAVRNLS
jgi:hypothetical protein